MKCLLGNSSCVLRVSAISVASLCALWAFAMVLNYNAPWKPEGNREMATPRFYPLPSEGKDALYVMLKTGLSGLTDIRDLSTDTLKSDITVILHAIQKDILHFKDAQLIVDGMKGAYEVEGWKCNGRDSTFYKTFRVGERKYRLRGRFPQDPSAKCWAEIAGLKRLLTCEEYLLTKGKIIRNATDVEIIPSLKEARHALLVWAREGDHKKEFVASPELVRLQVDHDLHSAETGDDLAEGAMWEDRAGSWVGKRWAVWLDDMEFQKTIARGIGNVPLKLNGRFALTSSEEWKVVGPFGLLSNEISK